MKNLVCLFFSVSLVLAGQLSPLIGYSQGLTWSESIPKFTDGKFQGILHVSEDKILTLRTKEKNSYTYTFNYYVDHFDDQLKLIETKELSLGEGNPTTLFIGKTSTTNKTRLYSSESNEKKGYYKLFVQELNEETFTLSPPRTILEGDHPVYMFNKIPQFKLIQSEDSSLTLIQELVSSSESGCTLKFTLLDENLNTLYSTKEALTFKSGELIKLEHYKLTNTGEFGFLFFRVKNKRDLKSPKDQKSTTHLFYYDSKKMESWNTKVSDSKDHHSICDFILDKGNSVYLISVLADLKTSASNRMNVIEFDKKNSAKKTVQSIQFDQTLLKKALGSHKWSKKFITTNDQVFYLNSPQFVGLDYDPYKNKIELILQCNDRIGVGYSDNTSNTIEYSGGFLCVSLNRVDGTNKQSFLPKISVFERGNSMKTTNEHFVEIDPNGITILFNDHSKNYNKDFVQLNQEFIGAKGSALAEIHIKNDGNNERRLLIDSDQEGGFVMFPKFFLKISNHNYLGYAERKKSFKLVELNLH